jgi:hypothetical protein
VIRFSGSDINRNPDKCVDRIEKYIKKVGWLCLNLLRQTYLY